jgi:hypothetical protein
MRIPHEQAATHGGRFRPRYESQAAAQHPLRHRAQNQRTGGRVARKPWPGRLAGSHCGGQEQPQPPQVFLIGRPAIFMLAASHRHYDLFAGNPVTQAGGTKYKSQCSKLCNNDEYDDGDTGHNSLSSCPSPRQCSNRGVVGSLYSHGKY